MSGKVWNWTTESSMEGTPMKFRATTTEESPTSYSFKLEMAAAGGDWTVLEGGKATKLASVPTGSASTRGRGASV